MKQLILLLIAFIAVATFITAYDSAGTGALENLSQETAARQAAIQRTLGE